MTKENVRSDCVVCRGDHCATCEGGSGGAEGNMVCVHLLKCKRLTLTVILTGIGMPSLISLVYSLNSLQKTPILTPLCGSKTTMEHYVTLRNTRH